MPEGKTLEEMLSKKVDEVERPPAYPVGTYLILIQGQPVFGKSRVKNTDFVAFGGKFLQAREDVSPEAVADFEAARGTSLIGSELKPDPINGLGFYLTPGSIFRFDEFLIDHLGIDKGRERKEMIADAPGKQVLVTFKHEPSQDGKSFVARVAQTARP